jgi:DNA-binding NarL/FixJ family response regulator
MPADIVVIPSRGPLPGPLTSWGYVASAAESGGSGTRLGKGERILVVEDDLLVASQMEAALSDAGFNVVGTAATREEALHLAQARSPSVVVMDIHLPDGDGIETALELFRRHGIRCIFASAYSDTESRQRATPAAPLGWLQKPYTMRSLTESVRAAVSELRSRRD